MFNIGHVYIKIAQTVSNTVRSPSTFRSDYGAASRQAGKTQARSRVLGTQPWGSW